MAKIKTIKISISQKDNLKIITRRSSSLIPVKQIHKDKKVYTRKGKTKQEDYNN